MRETTVKKTYRIELKGKHRLWSLPIKARPDHVESWRKDGLVVEEVVNTIPYWMPPWFVGPWVKLQDTWNHIRLW
jgi:hypothetical protein